MTFTSEGARGRVHEQVLGDASIEITARELESVKTIHHDFAPGTRVHVTFLPNDDLREVENTCIALSRAGFRPAPHLTARNFTDTGALDRHLARLAGEAGVAEALVIAGDVDRSRGGFATSIELMRTGLLARHGIATIMIAGHPEGHPAADNAVLDAALRDKIDFARGHGHRVEIVTQFSFEAEPIAAWLRRIRAAGIDVPVRVGVAGPAGTAKLLKYALRCGVGNSLRALRKRSGMIGMVLDETDPGGLLQDLADDVERSGGGPLAGIHIYTFGGLRKSSAWLQEARRQASSRSTETFVPEQAVR